MPLMNRLIQPRNARPLLLAVMGIAAIAGPIVNAQPAPQAAAPLAFEVASVKPVSQSWIQLAPQRSGGRINWTVNLNLLIRYAYHLQPWRIGSLPEFDAVYAIDATTDPAATEDQVRLMFQALLAGRFKMSAHLETKEINGYVLTTGKGALKIKEAKSGDEPAPLPEWFQGKEAMIPELEGKLLSTVEGRSIQAITGRRVPVSRLAEALQQPLLTFVLDKTGLPGNYYFAFQYAREDAPPDVDAPTLFTALQDLGLRLEKHKGPVEMLVIDHIEKTPTEN
jgi:uncharacterized protein (TIGR03435 family)